MFIVVSTSRLFDIPGEYESVDAAIQAIRERAGLYASSVKVEKRYVNKLGSDAALVSFLGEMFNIRQSESAVVKNDEPKLAEEEVKNDEPEHTEEEIQCDKRNTRIARILKESLKPCEKRAYVISCRYPEDKDYHHTSFVVDNSDEIVQFIEERSLCTYKPGKTPCTFATKGLASLVLAWFAFHMEEISFDFKDRLYNQSKFLQDAFDQALNTGRFYKHGNLYFVEAVDRNENTTPLCAGDLELPESYEQGFELYAPDQSEWR